MAQTPNTTSTVRTGVDRAVSQIENDLVPGQEQGSRADEHPGFAEVPHSWPGVMHPESPGPRQVYVEGGPRQGGTDADRQYGGEPAHQGNDQARLGAGRADADRIGDGSWTLENRPGHCI